MTASPTDFHGTDRFEILRWLGVGGMGVVYEVLDHERNERVALKTLRWADAGAIYRFKREFRILADVVHPNLVSLYELVVGDAEWFFTMELVDGPDFFWWLLVSHSAPSLMGCASSDPSKCRMPRSVIKRPCGVRSIRPLRIRNGSMTSWIVLR